MSKYVYVNKQYYINDDNEKIYIAKLTINKDNYEDHNLLYFFSIDNNSNIEQKNFRKDEIEKIEEIPDYKLAIWPSNHEILSDLYKNIKIYDEDEEKNVNLLCKYKSNDKIYLLHGYGWNKDLNKHDETKFSFVGTYKIKLLVGGVEFNLEGDKTALTLDTEDLVDMDLFFISTIDTEIIKENIEENDDDEEEEDDDLDMNLEELEEEILETDTVFETVFKIKSTTDNPDLPYNLLMGLIKNMLERNFNIKNQNILENKTKLFIDLIYKKKNTITNKPLIDKLLENNFTTNLCKPIVLDHKKFYLMNESTLQTEEEKISEAEMYKMYKIDHSNELNDLLKIQKEETLFKNYLVELTSSNYNNPYTTINPVIKTDNNKYSYYNISNVNLHFDLQVYRTHIFDILPLKSLELIKKSNEKWEEMFKQKDKVNYSKRIVDGPIFTWKDNTDFKSGRVINQKNKKFGSSIITTCGSSGKSSDIIYSGERILNVEKISKKKEVEFNMSLQVSPDKEILHKSENVQMNGLFLNSINNFTPEFTNSYFKTIKYKDYPNEYKYSELDYKFTIFDQIRNIGYNLLDQINSNLDFVIKKNSIDVYENIENISHLNYKKNNFIFFNKASNKNIDKEQYIYYLDKIIPSINDILERIEYSKLEKCNNFNDINKILQKYDLSVYNFENINDSLRQRIKKILQDRIQHKLKNENNYFKNLKLNKIIYNLSKKLLKIFDRDGSINKYWNLIDEEKIKIKQLIEQRINQITTELSNKEWENEKNKNECFKFINKNENENINNILDFVVSINLNIDMYKNYFNFDIDKLQEIIYSNKNIEEVHIAEILEQYKIKSNVEYNLSLYTNKSISLSNYELNLYQIFNDLKKFPDTGNLLYEYIYYVYNQKILEKISHEEGLVDNYSIDQIDKLLEDLKVNWNTQIETALDRKTLCKSFNIAKIYTSYENLMADNNNDEIYYDSNLDTTKYDVKELKKLSKDGSSREEINKHFENLYIFRKDDNELKDIIENAFKNLDNDNPRRKIKEGCYALLKIDDEKKIYKYINKFWIIVNKDEILQENKLMKPINKFIELFQDKIPPFEEFIGDSFYNKYELCSNIKIYINKAKYLIDYRNKLTNIDKSKEEITKINENLLKNIKKKIIKEKNIYENETNKRYDLYKKITISDKYWNLWKNAINIEDIDDRFKALGKIITDFGTEKGNKIYWSIEGQEQELCCIHYKDLVLLAGQNFENKKTLYDEFFKKYTFMKIGNGDEHTCKFCGERIKEFADSIFEDLDEQGNFRSKVSYENSNISFEYKGHEENIEKLLDRYCELIGIKLRNNDKYSIITNSMLYIKNNTNITLQDYFNNYKDDLIYNYSRSKIYLDLNKSEILNKTTVEESINFYKIFTKADLNEYNTSSSNINTNIKDFMEKGIDLQGILKNINNYKTVISKNQNAKGKDSAAAIIKKTYKLLEEYITTIEKKEDINDLRKAYIFHQFYIKYLLPKYNAYKTGYKLSAIIIFLIYILLYSVPKYKIKSAYLIKTMTILNLDSEEELAKLLFQNITDFIIKGMSLSSNHEMEIDYENLKMLYGFGNNFQKSELYDYETYDSFKKETYDELFQNISTKSDFIKDLIKKYEKHIELYSENIKQINKLDWYTFRPVLYEINIKSIPDLEEITKKNNNYTHLKNHLLIKKKDVKEKKTIDKDEIGSIILELSKLKNVIFNDLKKNSQILINGINISIQKQKNELEVQNVRYVNSCCETNIKDSYIDFYSTNDQELLNLKEQIDKNYIDIFIIYTNTTCLNNPITDLENNSYRILDNNNRLFNMTEDQILKYYENNYMSIHKQIITSEIDTGISPELIGEKRIWKVVETENIDIIDDVIKEYSDLDELSEFKKKDMFNTEEFIYKVIDKLKEKNRFTLMNEVIENTPYLYNKSIVLIKNYLGEKVSLDLISNRYSYEINLSINLQIEKHISGLFTKKEKIERYKYLIEKTRSLMHNKKKKSSNILSFNNISKELSINNKEIKNLKEINRLFRDLFKKDIYSEEYLDIIENSDISIQNFKKTWNDFSDKLIDSKLIDTICAEINDILKKDKISPELLNSFVNEKLLSENIIFINDRLKIEKYKEDQKGDEYKFRKSEIEEIRYTEKSNIFNNYSILIIYILQTLKNFKTTYYAKMKLSSYILNDGKKNEKMTKKMDIINQKIPSMKYYDIYKKLAKINCPGNISIFDDNINLQNIYLEKYYQIFDNFYTYLEGENKLEELPDIINNILENSAEIFAIIKLINNIDNFKLKKNISNLLFLNLLNNILGINSDNIGLKLKEYIFDFLFNKNISSIHKFLNISDNEIKEILNKHEESLSHKRKKEHDELDIEMKHAKKLMRIHNLGDMFNLNKPINIVAEELGADDVAELDGNFVDFDPIDDAFQEGFEAFDDT